MLTFSALLLLFISWIFLGHAMSVIKEGRVKIEKTTLNFPSLKYIFYVIGCICVGLYFIVISIVMTYNHF